MAFNFSTKKNRFGVKIDEFSKMARTIDGVYFHSDSEAKRWMTLKLLERAGEIKNLRRQIKFSLEVEATWICNYTADFGYYEKNTDLAFPGEWAELETIEESKGAWTPDFKIKWVLFHVLFGKKYNIILTGGKNEQRYTGYYQPKRDSRKRNRRTSRKGS